MINKVSKINFYEYLCRFNLVNYIWILITFSLIALITHNFLSNNTIGGDFLISYNSATRLFYENGSYHDPDKLLPINTGRLLIDRIHSTQSHPVIGAWYFYPFIAITNRGIAFYLYTILQSLAVFICLLLVVKTIKKQQPNNIRTQNYTVQDIAFFTLPIILFAGGTRSFLYINLLWGQTNILVLLFCVIAIILHSAKKYKMSSVIFSLAAADKIFPVLFCLSSLKFLRWCLYGLIIQLLILWPLSSIEVFYDLIRYPFVFNKGNYSLLNPARVGEYFRGDGFQFSPIANLIDVFRSLIGIYCTDVYDFWLRMILLSIFSLPLVYFLLCLITVSLKTLFSNSVTQWDKASVIFIFCLPIVTSGFWDHHLIFPIFGTILLIPKLKNKLDLILWIASIAPLSLNAGHHVYFQPQLALIGFSFSWFLMYRLYRRQVDTISYKYE